MNKELEKKKKSARNTPSIEKSLGDVTPEMATNNEYGIGVGVDEQYREDSAWPAGWPLFCDVYQSGPFADVQGTCLL